MEKTVVVFFGESGSGKSTICNYLKQQADGHPIRDTALNRAVGSARILNFADTLKDVVHRVFGIPVEILWGTKEQKDNYSHSPSGKTARELMQWVGETFRQGPGGRNVWVDGVIGKCVTSRCGLLLIGDGRHPDEELVYFRSELEKQNIRVFAVRIVPAYTGYTHFKGELAQHPSEANLKKADDELFDLVLVNDGSKESFEKTGLEQVLKLLSE